MPVKASSQQRQHQTEREVAISKARSLQRAREVVPHRLHWAFYMNGQPAEISGKDKITHDDLRLLQQLTLSQNPALYYGSGIRSGSGRQLKAVARFEREVVETLRRTGGTSGYGGGGGLELDGQLVDVGRYSRLSRTLTPGSPIMEIDETADVEPPPPSPLLISRPQETFLTDPRMSEHKPPL